MATLTSDVSGGWAAVPLQAVASGSSSNGQNLGALYIFTSRLNNYPQFVCHVSCGDVSGKDRRCAAAATMPPW